MELGDESYAGSRSFFRLGEAAWEAYGYKHLIPMHQGGGAEHLLAKLVVHPGELVPSNLYFTTSRAHVEFAGGTWVDVAVPEASDPKSVHPFKGNVDLLKLEHVLTAAAERVALVRVEACLNIAGGQLFSLANLGAVRELTGVYGVPLILDATRISENALFVKDCEPEYARRAAARADPCHHVALGRRDLLLEEGPLRPDRRNALSERRPACTARVRTGRRLRRLPALRRPRRSRHGGLAQVFASRLTRR
jgi:tryptophanase